LMGVDFKNSSEFSNNTSIYRPEVYSDYFALNNRCLFQSFLLRGGVLSTPYPRIGHHFAGEARTSTGNKIAEAPSSWTYGPTDNPAINLNQCDPADSACLARRLNFFKSCRIYEPWPEIESVTSQMEGGVEVAKVTFKGRIRSTFGETAGAPATVNRVITLADSVDLKAEPFRTDENGIREYLWMQSSGAGCEWNQPGNYALDAATGSLPSGVVGACFPDFLFVKLIEKPFEDKNDAQDAKDTPVTFDQEVAKEVYLRAICESFVDGKGTSERNCVDDLSGVYNFTFENLQYQAHGHAWLPLMSKGDRSDAPRGFWPVPNTVLRAERFNQFSNAINLLTIIPLMIPMNVEGQLTSKSGVVYHNDVSWPDPTTPCDTVGNNSNRAFLPSVTKIEMPTSSIVTWYSLSGLQQLLTVNQLTPGICNMAYSPSAWEQAQSTASLEVRVVVEVADQIHSMPETIKSIIETGGASFMLKGEEEESFYVAKPVTVLTDASQCGATYFYSVNDGYDFLHHVKKINFCKIQSGLTTFDPIEKYSPKGISYVQGDAGQFCIAGWGAHIKFTPLGGSSDRVLEIPLTE
jgi:hypothetical protein